MNLQKFLLLSAAAVLTAAFGQHYFRNNTKKKTGAGIQGAGYGHAGYAGIFVCPDSAGGAQDAFPDDFGRGFPVHDGGCAVGALFPFRSCLPLGWGMSVLSRLICI